MLFDNMLSIMACHSAIRARHKMAREEMTDLVRRLSMADLPTNCPHGRPVFKEITYTEIEKMFKRIL
jgi:DNA mismatch repair protein MutL